MAISEKIYMTMARKTFWSGIEGIMVLLALILVSVTTQSPLEMCQASNKDANSVLIR